MLISSSLFTWEFTPDFLRYETVVMIFPNSFPILFGFLTDYQGNSWKTGFHPCYCPLCFIGSGMICLMLSVIHIRLQLPPPSILSFQSNGTDNITPHFLNFSTLVPGSQQHPGAKGCEGHVLQPTVSPAVPLQLPQVAAQNTAELPAPRLGDEDSPQWTAFLHRPQQQNHHLGELTLCDNRLR